MRSALKRILASYNNSRIQFLSTYPGVIRRRHSLAQNITEVVGDTPLVRLNRVSSECRAEVYAKLEYMNPGGSLKDRIAVGMIRTAEQQGLIQPGRSVLIEATR